MTINKFIKECAKKDSLIGDLANDMLRDSSFPSKGSNDEIFSYLDFKTMSAGIHDIYLEFKKEYLNSN